MFDNLDSRNNDRPQGALDVAIRARAQEKAMAIIVADYRAENANRPSAKRKQNKGLLASLFAIFR